MPKHRQESVEEWMQDARDLAKAERELQIVHWVRITIGYRDNSGASAELYRYDFPRESIDRYRWIIRWRTAKLQCRYPREAIHTYLCGYDKRTGLKTDMGSCLSKLVAAKAQITKAERSMQRYIEYQQAKYPLFYDRESDPDLIKYRAKLETKKQNCLVVHENIRLAVEQYKSYDL